MRLSDDQGSRQAMSGDDVDGTAVRRWGDQQCAQGDWSTLWVEGVFARGYQEGWRDASRDSRSQIHTLARQESPRHTTRVSYRPLWLNHPYV